MTTRNPEQTRRRLLEKAFEEIHRDGFQAASLDAILAGTGVTKGALYHHFSSKRELGYAVVEEILGEHIRGGWLEGLSQTEDPIAFWQGRIREIAKRATPESIKLGCPINNLSQEMAASDEGFRVRLEQLYRVWRDAIAAALRRGQSAGSVRSDLDVDACAAFLVAAWEGCAGAVKNAQDMELGWSLIRGLQEYLELLRPAGEPKGSQPRKTVKKTAKG